MEEMNENRQMVKGAVSSAVQVAWITLATAVMPVLSTWGVADEFGALEKPVTALITAVITAALWWVLNTVQKSPVGQNPVVAAFLLALLGRSLPPTYVPVEIVDKVIDI